MNDSLGNRMKTYEQVERKYLTRRMPTLIRLDGKAFHSFTKGFDRPFDKIFTESMWKTAQYLCNNIMGCKIAYTQSDEITLLLTDYEKLTTEAWFDKNVQKMVSISASMATLAFNKAFVEQVELMKKEIETDYIHDNALYLKSLNKLDKYYKKYYTAMFDSRVFNLPKEEVCNCFIWRQQDATRNAIQMVGQINFSHKQLQNKNCNQIQEMLFQQRQINFNDLPVYQKRGACIIKEQYNKEEIIRNRWVIDKNIPIFTQDRNYIEKYL